MKKQEEKIRTNAGKCCYKGQEESLTVSEFECSCDDLQENTERILSNIVVIFLATKDHLKMIRRKQKENLVVKLNLIMI